MKAFNSLGKKVKQIFPIICVLGFYGVSANVNAFELLSEGALSSVSAASGPFIKERLAQKDSAGNSISGADSQSTKTKDGYDRLPFKAGFTLKSEDKDKVSDDLDFAFITEVEAWGEKLRDIEDERFELDVVNFVPFSKFDLPQQFDNDVGTRIISTPDGREGSEYQLGKLDQAVDVFNVTDNSISYEVRSHVERAATINASPFQDGRTYGSTYLSDITSRGVFTVATHD